MPIALIELLNKEVVIRSDGQNIKGIVKSVTNDSIILDCKEHIVTVFKSGISFYVMTGVVEKETKSEKSKDKGKIVEKIVNPYTEVPLTLLGCMNGELKCTGVRYFAGKKVEEISPIEFEKFMAACPCRVNGCKRGKFGGFGEIKPEQLSKLLIDSVFGEYPEIEEDETKK